MSYNPSHNMQSCGRPPQHPLTFGELEYTAKQINELLSLIPFKADRAEVPEMEKLSDVNYLGHVADATLLPEQEQPSWALVGNIEAARPYFFYVEDFVPKGYQPGWNDLSQALGTYNLTALNDVYHTKLLYRFGSYEQIDGADVTEQDVEEITRIINAVQNNKTVSFFYEPDAVTFNYFGTLDCYYNSSRTEFGCYLPTSDGYIIARCNISKPDKWALVLTSCDNEVSKSKNYNSLKGRPAINGVTLSGNHKPSELDLATLTEFNTLKKDVIEVSSDAQQKAEYAVETSDEARSISVSAESKSDTAVATSNEAKRISEIARNAVTTLEGLANATTAAETLAGQVVQIEENKQNIASNKADSDAKLSELDSYYEPKWEAGKLLDGRIVVEGDFVHSILPIDDGKDIEVSGLRHSTTQYIDAVNFFDKDMVFVGKNSTTDGTISASDIPKNAVFIGVTKSSLSKVATVKGGVLIYPMDSALVTAKAYSQIKAIEKLKTENIGYDSTSEEYPSARGVWNTYVSAWSKGKMLDGKVVVEGDYYHCVLPIDYGKDIEVVGLKHSTTQYIDAINFFDKDMVFVGKNSTTNGTISASDIPENAVFIGVTKEKESTLATVTGGVIVYPKNIAEVAAKHEHRIMESEKRLGEIGSGVCKFDNLLLDYNFNISSNQIGSSATYTRKDEYLEVSVENSNSRFFTPNAEYFSGKQGDYVLVILETFGEFSSTFSVMGTKAGTITHAGKYATSFNVNQSIDKRTYIGIINYKNWGGDDLGIGMQTSSSSGTSVFRFKRMCAINLGGDNDSRYKAYQKLGNQFFIELAHSTGFNPGIIFSDKNINYTWNGKKMVSIGDSTVASCNWQPIIAERLGLVWSIDETLNGSDGHKPMGVGGSMIAPYVGGAQGTKSGDSIYMRADDVKHYKPDVIFLLGGINDSWQSVNGSISDAPYTGSEFTSYPEGVSIYSYYKGVVLKLISQNPLAKLVCVCPAMPWARNSGIEGQRVQKNRLDDVYSKVIKEVAEYYGCLFVDTNKKWNINEYNIAVLNDDGLTYGESRYYRADSTNSCPHPNEVGARMWADVICMEIS